MIDWFMHLDTEGKFIFGVLVLTGIVIAIRFVDQVLR